jgi:carbon monoxide dehydrogenase subunit G
MRPCKPLSVEDFDRLSNSLRFETILQATPEQVFEVFEDPDSWPIWAGGIEKVTWTSPKPFGVGTTRDVELLGGLIAHEHFFVWEPPYRMAFYFVGTNRAAVQSLAEHYELQPLSGGRTRFVWQVAYEPLGPLRHVSVLLRPAVRLLGARIAHGLQRYVQQLPAPRPANDARAYG